MVDELTPHVKRLAREIVRAGLLRGQLLGRRLQARSPDSELEGFAFDFLLALRHELAARTQQ